MRQVWASMVTVVTVIGTQISRMIFIMEAQKLNSERHGEVQRCIHRTSGKLMHFVLIYYICNVLRVQLHPGYHRIVLVFGCADLWDRLLSENTASNFDLHIQAERKHDAVLSQRIVESIKLNLGTSTSFCLSTHSEDFKIKDVNDSKVLVTVPH